ncbi:hypothetical protein [Gordonia alkaliphila]|uniref:DUF222 domain-containing protein n=1 Tax=Gordonia alkaliphila TaxID=1053547 RepID=A0ABP8ZGR4_9ACTN
MSRFEDLRHEIQGTSWLDDAARASLSAAAAKFDHRRYAVLAVDVNGDLDAKALATIASGVQDAVARMGQHIARPSSDANRLEVDDRNRARLYPLRQIGRRLEFGFEDLDIPPLFTANVESYAERAAAELIALLPESDSDDVAVAAIPAHARAVRNVVNDLVKTVEASAGVGLTLSSSEGDQSVGVMTKDQAFQIGADLRESKIERQIDNDVEGRLDGVRTRRRIFFLELADGSTREGGYDPELAETVKQHLDRPVLAKIERVRRIQRAGQPGHWSYRLLALKDAPQPEDDLFSE